MMKPGIIALAPNAWDGPWMNRQQILSRLANEFSIVYSTGPLSLWDRGKPDWVEAELFGSLTETHGLWVEKPSKLIVSWPRFAALERAANQLEAVRLRWMMRDIGVSAVVGYVFHPLFTPLLQAIEPEHIVYHAYDRFEKMDDWNGQLAGFEQDLLQTAECVFASSEPIARALRAKGRSDVVVVPNGVDYEAFAVGDLSEARTPDDMKSIPRPRIGYVGNINRKVDLRLIAKLASRHPEFSFVFVGARNDNGQYVTAGLRDCREFPNVSFLGPRSHEELPRYVNSMDVNIICSRVDDDLWSDASYPLKLHEYLAAGRPIVSSDLEVIRAFSDVVDIATSVDDWSAKLLRAIHETAPKKVYERRSVARDNTWGQRVDVIRECLFSVVGSAC